MLYFCVQPYNRPTAKVKLLISNELAKLQVMKMAVGGSPTSTTRHFFRQKQAKNGDKGKK